MLICKPKQWDLVTRRAKKRKVFLPAHCWSRSHILRDGVYSPRQLRETRERQGLKERQAGTQSL